MTTKNIFLISLNNDGKTTLANVLLAEQTFKEDEQTSTHQDKEVKINEQDYRIIDTPGSDTPTNLIKKLEPIFKNYAQIYQIFLIYRGLPQKEQIELYQKLKQLGTGIEKHIAFIIAGSKSFQNEKTCQENINHLQDPAKVGKNFAEVFKEIPIIFTDSPPWDLLEYENEEELNAEEKENIKKQNVKNREKRTQSRAKIIEHLEKCSDNYPINNLNWEEVILTEEEKKEKELTQIKERIAELENLPASSEVLVEIKELKSKIKKLLGESEEELEEKNLVIFQLKKIAGWGSVIVAIILSICLLFKKVAKLFM